MEKNQPQLNELLNNYIVSSEMEGLAVSDPMKEMCLAVVNGTMTLDDCLRKIQAKHRR